MKTMRITMSTALSKGVLVVLLVVFPLGCSKEPSSVLNLTSPHFYVHLYADPKDLKSQLRGEGPVIVSRDVAEGAEGDFIISGTGLLYVGGNKIRIEDRAIIIGGEVIDSRALGYRNVLLLQNGRAEKDVSIPFEPWWSYHH
jgi:hypothetical protein